MTVELTPDGSLLDGARIIYLSKSRFVADVCHNGHCFVCGCAPSGIAYEQEHVISDWLVRKHGLVDLKIGLPGGGGLKYPRYKVPCCPTCNRNLGKVLEEPVSEFFSQGFDAAREELIQQCGLSRRATLYSWLSLIYFKTHYKDLFLRQDLKKPLDGNRIADQYEFEELHHIHCMARSSYTGATIDPAVIGSLFVLHAAKASYFDDFDYLDIHEARTIMVRSGDIALIAVLNDASICQSYLGPLLSRITGPVSPIQLRELVAHVSAINLALPNRPTFRSGVLANGDYEIRADIPVNPNVIRFDPEQKVGFGRLLEFALLPFRDLPSKNHSAEEMLSSIRRGEMTYLFKEDGSFREDSLTSPSCQEDPNASEK